MTDENTVDSWFIDLTWNGDYDVFNAQTYDALSQLAGHPLPIYEGGKWEQLYPTGSYSVKVTRYKQDEEPELPVPIPSNLGITIHRYTR